MNFPDLFNLPVISIIAAVTFCLVFAILAYVLYWKPKLSLPLQNERVIGHVTFWAPRGIGVLSGIMTTARSTMERYWESVINNAPTKQIREAWIQNRDFVLEDTYVFAIKDGSGNKIVIFDDNAEDQKYLDVDPEEKGYILHGVQDGKKLGEYGGFEYIGIKLSKTSTKYTKDELKKVSVCGNALKFLRDAARNLSKITDIREERDDARRELTSEKKDKAKMRSIADRATSALGQKSLTQQEELKMKGTIGQTLKQWFSIPQIIMGIGGYLIAPQLLVLLGWNLFYPESNLFYGAVAFVAFFSIPVFSRFIDWIRNRGSIRRE